MTPAKGQGSSRHKRKEIASDDPATRDVREEAAYFELDQSDEEEAQRDPDNECTPLIDPWPLSHHVACLITVTLENVANQLLLPILGDVGPGALELSPEEEAVKAKLRKGMSGNMKLSHWVKSFSKASVAILHAAFVMFWLYKFIFSSHPHYAVKPLYFQLAIKISTRVSLSLAPIFLGHLHLAKCRHVRFTKKRHQSYSRVITNFCGRFEFDFLLAFRWAGLKPIGHPAIEFFDKGVGFSWRAYRSLGKGFTCADSVIGPFFDTAGTITPLTSFDERGITYSAATNAGWLPYLADEGFSSVANPIYLLTHSFLFVFSFLLQSKHKEDTSVTHPILLDEPDFEAELEPISIYHPKAEEVSAAIGTPMEGFFDRADMLAESVASTAPAAAQGVPVETPIPSVKPVPVDECTHTERVSEPASIPTETHTPQKGDYSPIASHPKIKSPTTPLVISTSDPFAALSQAVKDGSSLVVTLSSIPSSATCGPDADLSSKGSKEVLEDFNNEPTMKKMISDFVEEEGDEHEVEDIETFEEPEVVASIAMPTVTPPAAPVALVSAMPSAPVSAIPSTPIYVIPSELVFSIPSAPASAVPTTPILTGPGPILTAPSQFKVGSSSAIVPDPVSEAATFFTRFDQPEVNDLDPADFWGSRPTYVDFHGFRVPEDCVSHLEAIYSSRGDFMQGFRLGRSAREHFLKLLGSVMNDIEHNFIDTFSAERILQWRAAIQELVSVGLAVEFILDHLREIARVFFMKKVQPTVDAIDTRIEALRKEVADLEGHRERLLSSIGGSSCFEDQPLISGLR
nr:uncharacterized protein LOC111986625 [Quercus suber]